MSDLVKNHIVCFLTRRLKYQISGKILLQESDILILHCILRYLYLAKRFKKRYDFVLKVNLVLSDLDDNE